MTLTTVVIPARNEEADLPAALASVLAQTADPKTIEIVVVDGASTDQTAIVAKQILDHAPIHRWAVLTNHLATTPTNLNMGLDWAQGEIIVRVDARSVLPPAYIQRTRELLTDPGLAVVGGRQTARPATSSLMARSIARALNNPLANGGARYRDHRASSGPSDTAYLGVFRANELREIGGWSVEFTSNQDFELSRRFAERGTVWYEAGLPVGYQPRATFTALLRQYRRFGRWKAIYWSRTGDRPRPRQLVLLAAPAAGVIGGATLLVLSPTSALRLAIGGLAAIIGIDHIGQETPGSPAERVGSALAMAIIGLGWWSGAMQRVVQLGKPVS